MGVRKRRKRRKRDEYKVRRQWKKGRSTFVCLFGEGILKLW
jgi:hypothetical protein